jgi:SPP1 family phage portal protein
MISENYKSQLNGRVRITADVSEITADNVIDVLQKAYYVHQTNKQQIEYLINYEKGLQPLQREKKTRKDIDIQVVDNLANEITNFRVSYKWGNKITFGQRADKDASGNDPDTDNTAINQLNEMFDSEHFSSKVVEAFTGMEISGVGYMMVDIKKDYEKNGSVFDIIPLDPLTTFVVYDNTVFHRPLMGVVYIERENGDIQYTCFTKDRRYEILNLTQFYKNGNPKKERSWQPAERNDELNPMGAVNIIEFSRSYDRTGCFERQIPAMDAVNILESDFVNDVAQNTQALWWINDADFPKDENGNDVTPVSGQWIATYTSKGDNKKPLIQPLIIQTNYEGILNDIKFQRDIVKQKANCPVAMTTGGGSTGTATSMSNGWEAAETSAAMETEVVKAKLLDVAKLAITAVKESTDTPKGCIIRKLSPADVQVNVMRKKNYDLATKANTFATLISHGVHPRHALIAIEAFPDTTLVYNDSKENIDKYLKALWEKNENTSDTSEGGENAVKDVENSANQDSSMQSTNSPIIGGSGTSTGGNNGTNKK